MPPSPNRLPLSAEALWVEAELVRTMMRAVAESQFIGWVVIAVFLVLMAPQGLGPGLGLWALAVLTLGGLRARYLRRFENEFQGAEPRVQLEFFRQAQWLWPASALVWGMAPALFFERTPLAFQFGAWLVLAVIAMVAANTLASHLRTARLYLHALLGMALITVLVRTALEAYPQRGNPLNFWLALFLLLYWLVLLQSARRLHQAHRRNFELQYRNTQLVQSLTRQTQAALHAVEVKNRFLASATHDIRQPVHALQLYADWLASEPDLVRALAPKIVESTQAVNRLFEALFDLVRLDSGHLRPQVEAVALDALLDEIDLQYQPLAKAKGLTLRLRRGGGTVQSDPMLLRRIVGNLVSNAIKYTERGGLLVAVRHGPRGATLEVWDTGMGIDPAHHESIFQEFFKVPGHPGTADGFGLGLHIVSRLAHILGHPIEMASRPGRGSVFRLRLVPTEAVAAAARAAAFDPLAS